MNKQKRIPAVVDHRISTEADFTSWPKQKAKTLKWTAPFNIADATSRDKTENSFHN